MQRYEGTKRLRARPMTRGEYNAYRGWTPPTGEDQTTSGYLVEYEDLGKANDSRHEGYISWSPADVLDRSYKQIMDSDLPPHQQRVMVEKADLDDKLAKLRMFGSQIGGIFDSLPTEEKQRLTEQEGHMASYSDVLRRRIKAFTA